MVGVDLATNQGCVLALREECRLKRRARPSKFGDEFRVLALLRPGLRWFLAAWQKMIKARDKHLTAESANYFQ